MLQLQLQAKEGTSKLEAEAHAARAKLARAEAIIEQQKARIGDFSDLMQRFVPQPRQFSIATPPHFEGATVCGPSIKTWSGLFGSGPSSVAPSDLTQGRSFKRVLHGHVPRLALVRSRVELVLEDRLVTLSHQLLAAEESQQVQAKAAAAAAAAAAVEAQHDKDELREQLVILEHRLQAEEGTSRFEAETHAAAAAQAQNAMQERLKEQAGQLRAAEEKVARQLRDSQLHVEFAVSLERTKLAVSEARTEAIIEQQKARIGDFSDMMQRFAPQPRQFNIATPPYFEGATVCGPSIKTLSGSFERGPSSLAPSDWTQGEPPASRPPAFDYPGAAHGCLAPPPPLPPVLSSCGPAAADGSGQPTASCAQGAASTSSAACGASPEVQEASECMAGGAHTDGPTLTAPDGRTTPRWFLMQEDGDGDTVSDCTASEAGLKMSAGRTGT
mmetsp:Transcript_88073/g.284405  ORF Transcript_88073/g.284405 Transcript_88073/m.284405 type:complete len:443 (-) Transcript_88073:253-1581(-)